jgi:hypothetical protein
MMTGNRPLNLAFLEAQLGPDEIRGRFADALRRGEPRWLWPEVEVEEWRSLVGTVAQITRDILTEGRSEIRLAGSPAAVSVAAFSSGMGPLLGHWLAEGRLAADEASQRVLACHLAHNQKRMARMAARTAEAVECLAARGVWSTVLKGMHTAFAYFPAPGTRPLSDIDLLIHPADESAASAALHDVGFRPAGKRAYPERTWRKPEFPSDPRCLYFVHEDDQWSIDLHLTLNLTPTSAAPPWPLDRVYHHDGAAWPVSAGARCLGQPGLLLYLAAHAGCHLISLTLIRLTELALVIREDTADGTLSWSEVVTAAADARVLGGIYPALAFCEQLAPGTVPEDVLRRCRDHVPARALLLFDTLTPATAHGMMRCSIDERFMWLPSRAAAAKQICYDLLPLKRSPAETLERYRMLAFRLMRRTITQ